MSHPNLSKGFSLIEMLVSVVIFVVLMIGIYYAFDSGQWLYLTSEKRANIQENARILLESMERDFRMIGHRVPTGLQPDGTGPLWNAINTATTTTIGFASDIDNGTVLVSQDAGTTSTSTIYVNDVGYYRDIKASCVPDLPIVIMSAKRSWLPRICNSIVDAGDELNNRLNVTVALTSLGRFTSDKAEVATIERVFYKYFPDTNYPYGTIQRIETDPTNDSTDPTFPADTDTSWIVLGTNVTDLTLTYWNSANSQITFSSPATKAELDSITKIRVSLTCQDRADQPQKFQHVTLTSDILIRNRSL